MVEYTRQLIHVPVLHCPADMGTLQEDLELIYVEQFGRRRWEQHLALIDRFWQSVRAELDALDLDYHRVDLYQDGLPLCGKELEIATETAAKGSENYQLLMDLISRGATLMGTEDPKLLLDEYRAVRAGLADRRGEDRSAKNGAPAGHAGDILAKRDAYIGRRIAETLVPGRTGILFLGMMHRVDPHLAGDILISRLHLDVTESRGKGRSRRSGKNGET